MTTYLITGANRGIGRGLADIILSRPNNTLIALVRDVDHESSKSLGSKADGTKVIVIKYEASDHSSAQTAIDALTSEHGITHLDVVVANAGMMNWRGPTRDITPQAIHYHLDVNTIAPILLFKETLPLLKASKQPPKFFAISSAIGSIEMVPKLSHASVEAYGMSKAAMNHAFKKLSIEHPDIDIEMLTPGPVATDLTREFRSKDTDVSKIPNMVKFDDSVQGLMKCVDNATRETTGGGFRDWKGETIPW